MKKPKGTPIKDLGLKQNTINRLKAVHGLSKAQYAEIENAYCDWFSRFICASPPPLPPLEDWKPITQRAQ